MRRLSFVLATALVLLTARGAAAAGEADEFAARQILVQWEGAERSTATRTKDEARALAEKALAEARKPGADFAALAKDWSDEKDSAAKGGFVGLFGRGGMAPEFERAVESLRDGEIAGPVESKYGFHVVQRLALAEARKLLFDNSFVLYGALFPWQGASLAIGVTRSKPDALTDATKAVDLLRAGMPLASLPPGLGPKPFRTGWMPYVLFRGTTRPEFLAVEQAAVRLEVGKVSSPIETRLGWLVVRRAPFFRAHVQHLVVMHIEAVRVPESIRRTREQARSMAEAALVKVTADPSSWAKVVAGASDDPTNAKNAGDLGVVEPGTMVPEFDAVVAGLAPGAMSGVVETRFGFHVIRRLD